eukprot:TRINITY_DN14976_c0_g1_i2.p1 TRINITY_DN14976_c0_g1~~TRINITY_DN14976_c0_g1_i2.p1  ORF type:complete len:760 (-),score=89.72 TRINITY_DN14976_c0_g1_i2:124-2403(-)
MGDKIKQWLQGLNEHKDQRLLGVRPTSHPAETHPTNIEQTCVRGKDVQSESIECHRNDGSDGHDVNRQTNKSAADCTKGDLYPTSKASPALFFLLNSFRMVPRQNQAGGAGALAPTPLASADVQADLTRYRTACSKADVEGWCPFSAFEADRRRQEVTMLTARLSSEVLMWEVVGGSCEGLLVRDGASLQSFLVSRPDKSRLMKGSLIREIDKRGERIFYHLLEGTGPRAGWISLRVKGKDVLACPFKTDAAERSWTLLRRLAMIPLPLQRTLSLPVVSYTQLSDSLHGPKGSLAALTEAYVDWPDMKIWLQHAACPEGFDAAARFSAFDAGDPVLTSLLMDPTLRPLQRTFPRLCMKDTLKFYKIIDPLCGLLPDTFNVAYFLAHSNTLSGAVRFGAQSTQSICHRIPHNVGEFQPYAHRGAVACVLYDAALWLARLSWHPNAVLKKITSQFSSPCPAHRTLLVEARLGIEESNINFISGSYGDFYLNTLVHVCLKADDVLIAFAEVLMASNPSAGIHIPPNLPDAKLAPPGVDWIPRELACAQLGAAHAAPTPMPWDAKMYLEAALDSENSSVVPPSCAAAVDPGWEAQRRSKDMRRIERASRLGSAYCNDSCFTSGLAPAAVSHVHYLDRSDPCGDRFEGSIKFGPQASEACFLAADDNFVNDGCVSVVAHFGLPMAAMEDFLAHLPRCNGREKETFTWNFEMTVRSLIPIGVELPFQCSFSEEQADAVGTRVQGSIEYNGQLLLHCTAIMTSIQS